MAFGAAEPRNSEKVSGRAGRKSLHLSNNLVMSLGILGAPLDSALKEMQKLRKGCQISPKLAALPPASGRYVKHTRALKAAFPTELNGNALPSLVCALPPPVSPPPASRTPRCAHFPNEPHQPYHDRQK